MPKTTNLHAIVAQWLWNDEDAAGLAVSRIGPNIHIALHGFEILVPATHLDAAAKRFVDMVYDILDEAHEE